MQKQFILIVDDVELNRAILHDIFCRRYDILEAADGEQALVLLEKHFSELAVMFLDTVMPNLDGFGVLKVMREKNYLEKLPVFLIASSDADDMMTQGLEYGIADIVLKPFHPSVIRRRVELIQELYSRRLDADMLMQERYEEIINRSEKTHNFNLFIIDTLATAIEYRDSCVNAHYPRMRGITDILLKEMVRKHPEYNLTLEQIHQINFAGVMHDIGKIAIPDYILKKTSPLTSAEFDIIKTHTIRGAELLNSIVTAHDHEYSRYYDEICRWHHEKWDGKGYPDGLVGDAIPISAQAVGLADCYDALTSDRSYKKAFSHDEAVKMILNGECGQFNPALLDVFAAVADQIKNVGAAVVYDEKIKKTRTYAVESEAEKITDRAMRLVETERERYRKLMELSNEIIFTYYYDSDTIELSERFLSVLGGAMGKTKKDDGVLSNLDIMEEDRLALDQLVKELSIEKPSFACEMRLRTKKKDFEWFKLRLNSFWDVDDPSHMTMIIGRLRNIDAFKREILQWKNQANTDPLTGLFNRYGMTAAAERIMAEGRKKQRFALIMLDVDNFKQVNDTHGHIFGDKVLIRIAEILRETMRSTDFLGRIGGDEFVIILRDISNVADAILKTEEVRSMIARFSRQDKLGISVSIGIAFFPRNGYSYPVLLEKSDKALYTAKQAGKDRVKLYTSAMEAKDYISMISKPD